MRRRTLLTGLAAASTAPRAWAQPLGRVEIGARAPDFTAVNALGRAVRLSALRGRPVLLEWTGPVCPFTAKKYAEGAMQTLQQRAAAEGVAWISVDTAAEGRPGRLTPAEARTRVADTHARVAAFLLDDGRLGRLYGARSTPSVYLIGADGRLLYQGAVDDDAYATQAPAAVAFVRDALDDLRAGRPQRRAETRPYGCPIEY